MTTFRGLEIVERIPFEKYEICKLEDNTYTCNCPAWIFHKGNKVNCKHITEYLNQNQKQIVIQELKEQKCQFCGKGKGKVQITDSETLRDVWICENCDTKLGWYSYPSEQEEIDDDKRHNID